MMTSLPSAETEGARRRVVLIDFDWQDADLLPLVLQRPGVAVRLVAGERTEDAGVKLAEVCGLPRTLDLADLTREIFDLALVGERSSRRARVTSLLEALRTPCLTPREFLETAADGAAGPAAGGHTEVARSAETAGDRNGDAAAPGSHAVVPAPPQTGGAPETARAAKAGADPQATSAAPAPTPAATDDLDAAVERALADIAVVTATSRPHSRATDVARALHSLAEFPSREDRTALEEALTQLVAHTGAVGAEVHAGRASALQLVAQVGSHDPLLVGMVRLALQLNAPQIIKGVSSPNEGKLWGAWPFRTIQHRGVVAASAIDPQGGVSPWEKMVDEMRERWDQKDRESAVRSFPLLPGQERAWLDPVAFRARLLLAVERNRFDGLCFGLHRLEFPGPPVTTDRLCEGLPQLLRDSDYLCRVPPYQILLLTAAPPEGYTHVRRRLLAAWELAWRECGQSPPTPPITDLCAELSGPEDAEGFLASAGAWMGGAQASAPTTGGTPGNAGDPAATGDEAAGPAQEPPPGS